MRRKEISKKVQKIIAGALCVSILGTSIDITSFAEMKVSAISETQQTQESGLQQESSVWENEAGEIETEENSTGNESDEQTEKKEETAETAETAQITEQIETTEQLTEDPLQKQDEMSQEKESTGKRKNAEIENADVYSDENIQEEMKEKRTESTKTFLLDNGNELFVNYFYPIHYEPLLE